MEALKQHLQQSNDRLPPLNSKVKNGVENNMNQKKTEQTSAQQMDRTMENRLDHAPVQHSLCEPVDRDREGNCFYRSEHQQDNIVSVKL